jgi:MFS family permease
MAFGLLMGGFSVGNLIGYFVAGSLRRPSSRTIRLVITALFAGFGIVAGSLGFITQTWLAFVLLVLLGLGNGYLAIIMFTWIQRHVTQSMMGRTMSLIMFSSLGLASVSQAVSGAIIKWNFIALFLIAGGLVLAMTAGTAMHPSLRVLSDNLAGTPMEGETNE